MNVLHSKARLAINFGRFSIVAMNLLFYSRDKKCHDLSIKKDLIKIFVNGAHSTNAIRLKKIEMKCENLKNNSFKK